MAGEQRPRFVAARGGTINQAGSGLVMYSMRLILAAAVTFLTPGCAFLTGNTEHDLRSAPIVAEGDLLENVTLVDPDDLAVTALDSFRTEGRPLVLVFGSFT